MTEQERQEYHHFLLDTYTPDRGFIFVSIKDVMVLPGSSKEVKCMSNNIDQSLWFKVNVKFVHPKFKTENIITVVVFKPVSQFKTWKNSQILKLM